MKKISIVILIALSLLFVCSCGGGGGGGEDMSWEATKLLETQNSAKELYEKLEAENDPNALQKTIDFLKEQENVVEAAVGDDNASMIFSRSKRMSWRRQSAMIMLPFGLNIPAELKQLS